MKSTGTEAAEQRDGWRQLGQRLVNGLHRKERIGRLTAMNRWMKRRIERSRARCEKAENERRESNTRNPKNQALDQAQKGRIFSGHLSLRSA